MRLVGLTKHANIDLTHKQYLVLNNQNGYGDMLLKIGNGRWKGSNYESENLDLGTPKKCITEQKEGLQYM